MEAKQYQETLNSYEHFFDNLSELIKTWNKTTKQASMINDSIQSYTATLKRIEDKTDFLIRLMIKNKEEKIT